VLFSAEVISGTGRDLAASIDRDLAGSRLVEITVLKGAVMFSCDLVRAMETETEMAFLSASSYSGGFTPGETLRLQQDIELDVAGRDVLIIDDIIDTGRTLTELAGLVQLQRPRSVSTVALVNKTGRRAADATRSPRTPVLRSVRSSFAATAWTGTSGIGIFLSSRSPTRRCVRDGSWNCQLVSGSERRYRSACSICVSAKTAMPRSVSSCAVTPIPGVVSPAKPPS